MADTSLITSSNPGVKGCAFRAPIGTTLPTGALEDLDAGFEDLGYVGEDGISLSIDRSTEDIKAYGGDTVYTVQTDYGEEITFTVLESANVEVLKTVFGDDNVAVNNGQIKVLHNKARLPRSTFNFDHVTDQGLKRQLVPIGQVSSVGDVVHVHTDVVKYELTVKTYPDADGNTVLEWIATDDLAAESLAVATAVVKKATENQPLTGVNLIATGGAEPYTWRVSAGTLPTGLELTTEGALTGTPTEAGTKTFTVEVSDSEGATATKELSITVDAAGA